MAPPMVDSSICGPSLTSTFRYYLRVVSIAGLTVWLAPVRVESPAPSDARPSRSWSRSLSGHDTDQRVAG